MPLLWWRVRDSNPRPPRCERGALPTELTPLCSVFTHLGYRTRKHLPHTPLMEDDSNLGASTSLDFDVEGNLGDTGL